MTVFTVNSGTSTAIRQGAIIVAKGVYALVQNVNYSLPLDKQEAPVQIDPVGEMTRTNALVATVLAMEAVDADYDNHYVVFAPSLVVNNVNNAKDWIQKFKKMQKLADKKAAEAGLSPKPIEGIKVKVRRRKEMVEEIIMRDEIEAWKEYFLQLGVKPFINITDSRVMTDVFKDVRKNFNEALKERAYNALREMGADIKETEKPDVPADAAPEETMSLAQLMAAKANQAG